MHNPILIAVVSHAVRTGSDHHLGQFQQHITTLIKELQAADDLDEIPWFEEAVNALASKVPPDAVYEMREDFKQMLSQISAEMLFPSCMEIRLQILIENGPQPAYPIESLEATFTIRWSDGNRIEYNCRPVKPDDGPMQGGLSTFARVADMFADQFIEAMVRPGLDTFHDQVAKPFDNEKFNELMMAMDEYINSLEASEREPYQFIKARMEHQFGAGPPVQMVDTEKPLEFLDKGGGFKT